LFWQSFMKLTRLPDQSAKVTNVIRNGEWYWPTAC
jgi:hypothetical protein